MWHTAPVQKGPKILQSAPTAALFFCYATFISQVSDLFVNTEDLEHTMVTDRAAFPEGMIVRLHIFTRQI
jgi:hypothetical protein